MNAIENESRLVIEACQGSVEAFESLVISYEPRIRRMIYGLTQDVQLTQDLCQETFLAVYRNLPRMKGEDLRFSPWLYRIALNQVRSEWRRRKYVQVIPFSLTFQTDDGEESDERSWCSQDAFEESVETRDLIQQVLR